MLFPIASSKNFARIPDDLALLFRRRGTSLQYQIEDFYAYLRDVEMSAENLEFWFIVRNHNKLFRRYKEIQSKKTTVKFMDIIVDYTNLDDIVEAEMRSNDRYYIDLMKATNDTPWIIEKIIGVDFGSMDVSLDHLRLSINFMYDTFLEPGAVKEINVPQYMRDLVEQRIFVEQRIDPKIFEEVRDATFQLMKNDSYQRYRRSLVVPK